VKSRKLAFRVRDSLGEIQEPAEHLWGAPFGAGSEPNVAEGSPLRRDPLTFLRGGALSFAAAQAPLNLVQVLTGLGQTDSRTSLWGPLP